MLDVTHWTAIFSARNANQAASNAEADADRLRLIVRKQAEIIAIHEKKDASNEVIIKAFANKMGASDCSIAGYRAYIDHMRGVCSGEVLTAASDAYVVACDARAKELGRAPLSEQQKSAK